MIRISTKDDLLIVRAEEKDFAPRHHSQLAFWGFQYDSINKYFFSKPGEQESLSLKLTSYLEKCGIDYEVED